MKKDRSGPIDRLAANPLDARAISGAKLGGGNRPLVLTRSEAAGLCRISLSTFDNWVRKGILPGPINGTRRWSRLAMEHALGGGLTEIASSKEISAFEGWKRANAA
jgi:hypothetical protein